MGLALEQYNDDGLSPQIRALLELEHFLSSPSCVGLDNVKESLRNSVQLMLELKGFSTGYDLSHLLVGEHSSMAMDGVLKDDRIKKKKAQQLLDDLMEIEREMARSFTSAMEDTYVFINNIETKIDAQLEAIDEQIENIAENEEHAEQLKKSSKKRKRLKLFKKHVKEHKQELEEAEDTKEIISIQQDLKEDLEDFNAGKDFAPKQSKTYGMSILSGFKDFVSKKRTHTPPQENFYNFANDLELNAKYQSYRRSETSGSGSNGGKSSGESGSGDQSDGKQDTGIAAPYLDI